MCHVPLVNKKGELKLKPIPCSVNIFGYLNKTGHDSVYTQKSKSPSKQRKAIRKDAARIIQAAFCRFSARKKMNDQARANKEFRAYMNDYFTPEEQSKINKEDLSDFDKVILVFMKNVGDFKIDTYEYSLKKAISKTLQSTISNTHKINCRNNNSDDSFIRFPQQKRNVFDTVPSDFSDFKHDHILALKKVTQRYFFWKESSDRARLELLANPKSLSVEDIQNIQISFDQKLKKRREISAWDLPQSEEEIRYNKILKESGVLGLGTPFSSYFFIRKMHELQISALYSKKSAPFYKLLEDILPHL